MYLKIDGLYWKIPFNMGDLGVLPFQEPPKIGKQKRSKTWLKQSSKQSPTIPQSSAFLWRCYELTIPMASVFPWHHFTDWRDNGGANPPGDAAPCLWPARPHPGDAGGPVVVQSLDI